MSTDQWWIRREMFLRFKDSQSPRDNLTSAEHAADPPLVRMDRESRVELVCGFIVPPAIMSVVIKVTAMTMMPTETAAMVVAIVMSENRWVGQCVVVVDALWGVWEAERNARLGVCGRADSGSPSDGSVFRTPDIGMASHPSGCADAG